MAAVTQEDLADFLDEALSWRRTELQAFKSELDAISKPHEGSPRSRALRRAAVALLYAHWEGFVKEACQAYLDFVAVRRLKYGELNDAFLMLGVRRGVDAVRTGDPLAIAKVVELVRDGSSQRAAIDRVGVVNTRSNLRHETLIEILGSLGLPVEPFDLKGPLIDRSLCNVRNDIAHGKTTCPAVGEFDVLHFEILGLMVQVQNLVLLAAFGSHYRAEV